MGVLALGTLGCWHWVHLNPGTGDTGVLALKDTASWHWNTMECQMPGQRAARSLSCCIRAGGTALGPGRWQGWGHQYLLQQQCVPTTLGQVVRSKGALDAGPDDDGIVRSAAGLSRSSHVCPHPVLLQLGAEPRGRDRAESSERREAVFFSLQCNLRPINCLAAISLFFFSLLGDSGD